MSTRVSITAGDDPEGGYVVAGWGDITAMPGCDQIAVSHGSAVHPSYRKKGYGKKLHELKLSHSKHLGYDYTICSVASTNAAEKHILASNGWKKLDEFKSSKTENTVEIWGRRVGELTEAAIIK